MAKKWQRVIRPATVQERTRHAEMRAQAEKEFPPRQPPRLQPAAQGIPAQIRAARQAQGLTWYALAKKAGIPNPNTLRDIEYGRDAKLSNVRAVAEALGLDLVLVDSAT